MATIWELDFYSRPILDEREKKVWEVLVCESPQAVNQAPETLFRYAEYCDSGEVNSVRLRQALERAIAQAPQPPDKIRFFRRQLTNMITKACSDLGVLPLPSRRTVTLNQWLEERSRDVYPLDPNYREGVVVPSVQFETPEPKRLPDALNYDRLAFVTLEAGAFADMTEWSIDFGEAFPLEALGLTPETRVPGVLLFSSRALPLAAWMSGLEMAFVRYEETPNPCLVLDTGANERWLLRGNLAERSQQQEAKNFELAKQAAQNVHFIGVQSDPQSEAFSGFWLLQEVNLA